MKYSLFVTLCNFMGECGVGSHTFVVLTRAKPRVAILGSATRTMRRSETLRLAGVGSIANCDSGLDRSVSTSDSSSILTSSNDLVFSWKVYSLPDRIELKELESKNTARTSTRFILDPYRLPPMSSIAFELTAYSSSGTSSSTSSVEVNVVQGAVVARMVDYTDVINMSPRDQVTIDGSASYDSDGEYFYRKLYGSEVDSSMKEEMLFQS